jgi:predicted nucleic acid-binding protein
VKQCLADTGALVALLDRADIHHAWAVECFKTLRPPLITCESVLAETLHLLADLPPSVAALARLHGTESFALISNSSLTLRLSGGWSKVPRFAHGFRRCPFWCG